MPSYVTRPGATDTPEPVPDAGPPAARKRGKRMSLEPSTDDPDVYATSLAPDAAMAASAIIGPSGGHDAGGQAGLGTGIAN
jgi:hypothetical protein